MTLATIDAWLTDLGLGKYIDVFAENDVDMRVLAALTDDDFRELGVSLGHRRLIQQTLSQASEESAPTTPAPEVTATPVVPDHLARRIIESRYALAGERKQVTVLFADIKGSMAHIAGTDPEYASRIIDPTVNAMMHAVHRFEGTVNRVLGDGIMALFGAPLAHEDHAVRACYAALAMRNALADISATTRSEVGIDLECRIGLNSGEVIVRAISNDLTMNYDAIGETTHLAARMEQTARVSGIRLAESTHRLARDYVVVDELGAIPVKGMTEPVETFELLGASAIRTRMHASAAAGFTRFVGRQAELGIIEQSQRSAEQGHGRVVGVVGEPGVGKSRLYYEYMHSGRLDNWLALECGTVSHGKANAYVPITDLLRAYFGVAEDDSPRLVHERVLGRILTLDEKLRETLPALLFLLDVPVDDSAWGNADPVQRRRWIRDTICELFLREAATRPVALMLEDLHWFDTESLGVVSALVERLGGTSILMLVNFRPEFQEPWASSTLFNRIRLEPLGAAVAQDLLENLLGSDPSLAMLKTALIERAEGNPFFLEESVRALVEQGVLAGRRGHHKLAREDVQFDIPASVHAVLAARMDRLEPDDKHILQCAAVVGKNFSQPLLLRLAQCTDAKLDAALDALQSTGFVHETRLFPEKEYTFRHALTHEVAYQAIIGHRRIELHGAALDAYNALTDAHGSDLIVQLAYHAFQGERWEQAFSHGISSGHSLAEQNATQAAIAAYLQALEAFEHLDKTDAHMHMAIDLHFRIRDALFVFGDPEKIGPHLAAAKALAQQLDDPTPHIWATLQQSGARWAAGEFEPGVADARAAHELALSSANEELVALAEYRLGISLAALGRFVEAIAALESALSWLDTDTGRKHFQLGGYPYTFVQSFLAWAYAELGDHSGGIEAGRAGMAHAERERHAYSQSVAGFGLGRALCYAGRTQEAITIMERAVLAAKEADAYSAVPWIGATLAYANAAQGLDEKASAVLEEMEQEEILARSPKHAVSLMWMVRACLELGDNDYAQTLLSRTTERAARQREHAMSAWCHWARAELCRRAGRSDQAHDALGAAKTLASELSLGSLQSECAKTEAALANR